MAMSDFKFKCFFFLPLKALFVIDFESNDYDF